MEAAVFFAAKSRIRCDLGNRMHQMKCFTPAKIGRASEDVALQIEAAIISGDIRPGERLPSERELQGHFETGRGVIREALGALRQKGLIEVKKGAKGGAFVKQVEVRNASESLALFLAQQEIHTENLIEFRESIDRTVTMLGIARGSAAEKADLVKGAKDLWDAVTSDDVDLAALIEMDRRLNLQFAKMTKNPIFEWIMEAMQLGFSSLDHALYETRKFREKTVCNWVATAQNIADGEPMKALSTIGSHYIMLRNCLAERESDGNRDTAEFLSGTGEGKSPEHP